MRGTSISLKKGRTRMKIRPQHALAVVLCAVFAAAVATIALGSPGSGVVTTILGHRATLSDSVQVNDDRIKFQTKDPTNFQAQTSPSSRTVSRAGITTRAW